MTEDIRAAVAAERRDQAGLLSGLTVEQWLAPSLCERWTVKGHAVGGVVEPGRPGSGSPGGGPAGALSHDIIHGLDITVALGLDRRVPHDRLRIVLDGMKPANVRYFGADLGGKRLEATALDWTFGAGEPVRGLAQDLLLLVCGRTLPPGRLS